MTALLDEQPAPDLSGMTKPQLLDYAADAGVEGLSSAMNKAEILAAIEGAEQGAV